MPVDQVSGQLSLLRVHDKGSKYGPSNDQIDVEVIAQFAGRPGEAFGFQLRTDSQGPAREGMLGLLRDGFNHGWIVSVDYERDNGRKNGVAFRVWLTKPPPHPAPPVPPIDSGRTRRRRGSLKAATRRAR
jgi:hypothetical protein